MDKLKLFGFYWLSSVVSAVAGYNLLYMVMPGHYVFGFSFRMIAYHWQYPIGYIIICCTSFAFLATLMHRWFCRVTTGKRIGINLLIILLMILISSPLGGMLWHVHDMMEGWWPRGYWIKKLFIKGPLEGLMAGWFYILLSFPYAYLGAVVSYFIMWYAAKRFPLEAADKPGTYVVLRAKPEANTQRDEI